jgi:hypothetical protein
MKEIFPFTLAHPLADCPLICQCPCASFEPDVAADIPALGAAEAQNGAAKKL